MFPYLYIYQYIKNKGIRNFYPHAFSYLQCYFYVKTIIKLLPEPTLLRQKHIYNNQVLPERNQQ